MSQFITRYGLIVLSLALLGVFFVIGYGILCQGERYESRLSAGDFVEAELSVSSKEVVSREGSFFDSELVHYARQYRKPGADIRLIQPAISITLGGGVQTIEIPLWIGNVQGLFSAEVGRVNGLDIYQYTKGFEEVSQGQAYELLLDVYAPAAGLYYLPITTQVKQASGQFVRRSLTLVLQVGDMSARSTSSREELGVVIKNNIKYEKKGELLKIYPAEEEIH